jgi:hypothetical protein
LPKDRPPPPTYQHSPVVSEYFRHCEEERRRTRGDGARLLGAPGEIFPNVALLPRQPRTIAVWHPRGAHQTEVWRWFLVDREAPQEVKDFLRDYYIRYSGPAGMTEQDDMENWNYAHQASRGTIARRYPYSYEMGLGTAEENFEWDGLRLPGRVIDITKAQSSEEPMRNLYRRWAQFMEATSWRRGAMRKPRAHHYGAPGLEGGTARSLRRTLSLDLIPRGCAAGGRLAAPSRDRRFGRQSRAGERSRRLGCEAAPAALRRSGATL